MFSRNQQRERRVSPSRYKLLLTSHILVSVGWLGTVFAKLVLGLVAVRTSEPELARALLLAMNVVNLAFPPIAIATIVTGVLLSLGTRWGLLQHYWVIAKQALTVGVIVTAVRLGDRLIQQSAAGASGQALDSGTLLGIVGLAALPLIALSLVHLVMLGLATVLSVYKPWGLTPFGRRKAASVAYWRSVQASASRDRSGRRVGAG